MKIAIVTSNNISVNEDTKKGTEILFRILVNNLAKQTKNGNVSLRAFCSGDSELPVSIESIDYHSTSFDKTIPPEKNIIFELALLSKAFSMQDQFDIYHLHIGDGDIVLPFAQFVSKPLLITLHHTFDKPYVKRYFSLFQHLPNVYFVSLSNYQRTFLPELNFIKTIYNGIETEKFTPNANGGETMMWSGRGDPVKGLDTAFRVINKTRKKTKFFIIRKSSQMEWLEKTLQLISSLRVQQEVLVTFDVVRDQLIKHYQNSKLFLFPTNLEESCPLSALESMACGTPVVAFARGSVPEIVKDGETGFLVNPSDNDIRGDWTVKKTGIDGLCEAIEKVYSMTEKEYQKMRHNCRSLVEKSFSASRMAEEYLEIYRRIVYPEH